MALNILEDEVEHEEDLEALVEDMGMIKIRTTILNCQFKMVHYREKDKECK